MKKLERGVFVFLVLVLVLSAGISYLALHQAVKASKDYNVEKMAIAIVNEDQGSEFNGEEYEFGTEFIQNIEKDNTHNWYVVSRGVAENGLNVDQYQLMIVIPNDFTQNALSINKKVPEKVTLNYKINASGNNNIKEKAEKTVSSILGEFNRTIIDIYFASIIGNLQVAQENVTEIVKKEEFYSNFYNQAVNNRLANYTSQFEALQNGTNVSETVFKGFHDRIIDFESQQGEGVQTAQGFYSDYQDFVNRYVDNGLVLQDLSKQLSQLDQDMNNDEVLKQLEDLQAANKVIHDRFQVSSTDHMGSIEIADSHGKTDNTDQIDNANSLSISIQTYLEQSLKQLEEMNKIYTNLQDTVKSHLQEVLEEELGSSSEGRMVVELNDILVALDRVVQNSLQSHIDELPTLNPDDIDQLHLQDGTAAEVKAAIAVTKKYIEEFGYEPRHSSEGIQLIEQVGSIESNGVTVSDSVLLPANKKTGQELTLKVPDKFNIVQVLLALPNSGEQNYTSSFKQNGKIVLPANAEGTFTVKLKLNLKETSNVDLLQPVSWSWNLVQKDVTNVDSPNSAPNSESAETPEQPVVQSLVESESAAAEEPLTDEAAEAQSEPAVVSEPAKEQETGEVVENPNESTTVETKEKENQIETADAGNASGTQPVQEEVTAPAVEKVTVVNNHIGHQVMSPLINQHASEVMQEVTEMVSLYQTMFMLYDIYFGIDMFNADLKNADLADLASSDSFYSLFNKQDAVTIVGDFILEEVMSKVYGEKDELQTRIETLTEYVSKAKQNADRLSDMIESTAKEAEVMNDTLNMTIAEVAQWREQSLTLADEQANVLENVDGEQSAVIALDDDFNRLLVTSESLAQQSGANVTSADHVYETLNTIEDEAKNIQNSGVHLVKQANDLSVNLANKLIEDKNFTDNFAEVLVNSRIGDRQNEHLYSMLSNPVQTQKAGVIAADDDTSIPYFLVLICTIVALFTAYAISNNERRRIQKDSFEGEQTLVWRNRPITALTASIGVIEGLVIGALSAYLLHISQEKFLLWTGLIILMMLAMLLIATYLLRQLKMLGMFVLLIVMSMYLFLTKAVGLHFDEGSLAGKMREFSPLQYIENLLSGFLRGAEINGMMILGLVIVILISMVGHLFVVNRFSRNEGVEDEDVMEAH